MLLVSIRSDIFAHKQTYEKLTNLKIIFNPSQVRYVGEQSRYNR